MMAMGNQSGPKSLEIASKQISRNFANAFAKCYQLFMCFITSAIVNRPVGVYETANLTVYDPSIEAVLTRVELCFEWGIGENDARTLAYEVAAAASPRRGVTSLRSSHAVDSVGVERRVSPPPRRWGASLFLESFEWETTV